MTSELRITDTNSADDSSGAVWGIEGSLFWLVIGGAFVCVVGMLLLFSMGHVPFLQSFAISAVPFTVVIIYVFVFKQGRPPFYDIDCLEWALAKLGMITVGFTPRPRHQPEHPLHLN